VIPGLAAVNKTQLLDELAQRAGIALKIDDREIASALYQRERLGSTGVGHGIAVPHARIAGLKQPFGLLVRLEHAIAYEAIDGAPVDLVFLLLMPINADAAHLAALATISRRLRDAAVAKALRNAASAKEMYETLVGA
jgi:nitrogen PTS system EIIA component